MSTNVSFLTYSISGLAFLLLALLFLTRKRSRPLGHILLLSSIASAVWSGTIAAGTLLPYPPIYLMQLSELARTGFWLYFLMQLLSFQEDGDVVRWMGWRWRRQFAVISAIAVIAISLRPLSGAMPDFGLGSIEIALGVWVLLSIGGLLAVEQVYRNAQVEERWGVKYLCLGLGALFTYDFFMYSDALLFQQLDAQLWQARGIVNAAVAPLLLVSAARNRNWRMDVHVSRHVVFHTITLISTGVYLLAMAAIGYFIKYLGGNWGGVLQISFLAGSITLLIILFFSGTLRAKIKVALSKHFFSYRYDYREEWLRFTEGLAALGTEVPKGIIRTMGRLTTSPGGILIHRGSTGSFSELCAWDTPAPVSHELGNIPHWVSESDWIVDLREWRDSPDSYPDLSLPQWLIESEVLWLIVPLFFQNELEAILILAKTDLKDSVNWEDRDLLKTAARQAAALLAQQRASNALVEARQFDAFNRLSAYVVHDLKNILAQQSLLVSNARKHRTNPEFIEDMIATIENSVKRMHRLMEQMRSGIRSAEPESLDLKSLLLEVTSARAVEQPCPELRVLSAAHVNADRERLATVFTHLLQNAQEATPRDGKILVQLCANENTADVSVRDTGCGMSDDFIRYKLFKPFESTKGLTGMGIGVFESREYLRQLGGDILVSSQPGEGTEFRAVIPLHPSSETSS